MRELRCTFLPPVKRFINPSDNGFYYNCTRLVCLISNICKYPSFIATECAIYYMMIIIYLNSMGYRAINIYAVCLFVSDKCADHPHISWFNNFNSLTKWWWFALSNGMLIVCYGWFCLRVTMTTGINWVTKWKILSGFNCKRDIRVNCG